MKVIKADIRASKKDFEKWNNLNKKEIKIENSKKYILKFNDIFVSFKTEKENIDVDKSYILSNKKNVYIGVEKDYFLS